MPLRLGLRLGDQAEAQHPQQVQRRADEDDRPGGQQHGLGQNLPLPVKVGVGQKLERGGQLHEAERRLDAHQPGAAARDARDPLREQGEHEERQGEGQREGQQPQRGPQGRPARRRHQQRPHERRDAGERRQHERNAQQPQPDQAAVLPSRLLHFAQVDRQRDRDRLKERQGEDDEQREDQQIDPRVRPQFVQPRRPGQPRHQHPQPDIEEDNSQRVARRQPHQPPPVAVGLLDETGQRDGDEREHARRQQGEQPRAERGQQEQRQAALPESAAPPPPILGEPERQSSRAAPWPGSAAGRPGHCTSGSGSSPSAIGMT